MLTRSIKISALIIFIIISHTCLAQDMKSYEAQWEGLIQNGQNLSCRVSVKQVNSSAFTFQLATGKAALQRKIKITANNLLTVKIDSDITFTGLYEKQKGQIRAFIQSGHTQYHIILNKTANGIYTGKWNLLLVGNVNRNFYLDVENGAGEKYEAYAFSGDPRFTRFSGFMCYDFNKSGDLLNFKDIRTGLTLKGKLLNNAINLDLKIAGLPVTSVLLHRSAKPWNLGENFAKLPFNNKLPADLKDGLPVNSLTLAGFNEHYLKLMVDSINANKITNTQSVLISRGGKLVYEQYFGGFDADAVHDMRSASKSISSAIIGIAIDKGILKDTAQKLFDFLPEPYKDAANGDKRKQAISIGSLLTMSSGLDAVDFGTDRKSVGSEDEYQQTADWAKTVVNAPMINYPGTHANYSSANPYLLGVMLSSQMNEPLEQFIDHNLFEPLGINNYTIFADDKGLPYFGGGMFLRPRDMLKFGLLYADKGRWNNKQIISKEWVEASFKNYLVLENHNEKPGYGFLWWKYSYKVNGKIISSTEARGAGGQYIFIIPEYQLVIVITSANFRGRVWQPEKIVENYILPAVTVK